MYSVYNDKEHYLHSGYDFIAMKDDTGTWSLASANIAGYQVCLGVYKNKFDIRKEIESIVNHFDTSKNIYRLKYNIKPEKLTPRNNVKLLNNNSLSLL